jgi:hypothetical protein
MSHASGCLRSWRHIFVDVGSAQIQEVQMATEMVAPARMHEPVTAEE